MHPQSAIRDGFTADHQRLEEIVTEVLAAPAATNPVERQRMWRTLEARIQSHFEAEEKYAIPKLMAARPRDGHALLAEHKHLRRRLAELAAEIGLSIARFESALGFVDELRAHARHEETLLYRWCDDHLDSTDKELLLTALADAVSSDHQGHSVPA